MENVFDKITTNIHFLSIEGLKTLKKQITRHFIML